MSHSAVLRSATPNLEEEIMYIARVSNPKNQDSGNTGLLRYCMKNNHWSVFEMANIVIEINTSRAIARQILRHRSFSFQEFCIDKDSKISTITQGGKIKLRTIEELYKLQNDSRWGRLVRVYDEKTKTLVPAKVKEVFDTGIKPVYLVTLKNGKQIKSTKDHKFLTTGGFKRLEDLSVGDAMGCNGIPVYQDFGWMNQAKKEAVESGIGVQYIADKAGCSYHTIRKWLKIHELKFTKKEVASYTQVWNKGLAPESQPMFGKLHSDETREKMYDSSRKGKESNLFINGNSEDRKWRQKVYDWQYKYKNKLIKEQERCQICDSQDNLEIDHIMAVSHRPDLAFHYNNLQILCRTCHREKSNEEYKQTVKWSQIESITYIGEQQTYDMEVNHVDHNYVADGIITHNSQRYANVNEIAKNYILSEARLQDTKNRQNSIETSDDDLSAWFNERQTGVWAEAIKSYNLAIDKGIAKEQARVLLPEGLTPSRMFMNGTVRSWIHYVSLRCGNGTQKEHQALALQCRDILCEQLPALKDLIMEVGG